MKAAVCIAFVLLLSTGRAAAQPAAPASDKAALLQGVGQVPLPSAPDALCTTVTLSEQPEIILTAELNPEDLSQSFQLIALASSRLGKGKVLAFSTPAYFRQPLVQEAEVQKLLLNCLRWGSPARRKRVQVWGGDAALTTFLTRQAQVKLVGTAATPDPSADILLLNENVSDTVQISRIEKFVRQGGTLLFGCPLPDMQRQQPRGVLAELPLNRLLQKAGLVQSNYMVLRYPQRAYLVASQVPAYLGIKNIVAGTNAHAYQRPLPPMQGGYSLTYTLEKVLALSPEDSPIRKQLQQAAHYWPDSLFIPTVEKPVKAGDIFTYQLQHLLQEKQLRDHPNPAYIAPAAATFPGAVPVTAARVSTELALPVRVGSNGTWEPAPSSRQVHSTGLYVPAGEKVVIQLLNNDSTRWLQAQIGVHSDDLTSMTQITREGFDLTRHFNLTRKRTEIYSPYGGLLLLNIPDTTTLKVLPVKVVGAVRAPRFQLGQTSVAEWQQTIRQYPAPWAELASDNISLTVPAARIRTLDNPEKLLAFWDAVLATDARLAALPAHRRHPERIIVDQQVGLPGVYMFTDPDRIVVPNDESCRQLLDVDHLRRNGSWVHFHELGHRHQFHAIDFEGVSEAVANLYTLYVFDKLLRKGLYDHQYKLFQSRQQVAAKVAEYLADSPSFEKWQADQFLALAMYMQLVDAFGWEPIEQVYRQFRQLPKSQYPATEAARRDYWFAAISHATHRNLAPFFARWQVPVGAAAAQAVAAYPTWLPAEMQPR